MSFPQHVTYARGGTVSIDLDSLPHNAIATVLESNGSSRGAIVATVSTIDTSLAANTARGALSITVASNTGIAANSSFWVQDDPEELLARKVDGATIHLRRPAINPHTNGARVEGSRISATVNSSVANAIWWDGRVEWNVDGSVYGYTIVECTRSPIGLEASSFSVQDLFDEDPKMYELLSTEVDLPRLRSLALDEILERLAGMAPDQRARVYYASSEFRRATVLAAFVSFYRPQAGAEAKELYERYCAALDSKLSRVASQLPRDSDQDGVVESEEKISGRNISLHRS